MTSATATKSNAASRSGNRTTGEPRAPLSEKGKTRTARRSLVLLLIIGLIGCAKPPELTRDDVKRLIESSGVFQAPLDSHVVFTDATYVPAPGTKREVLKVTGLLLHEDGPFGMAGQTATASFTWQWNLGPFAGRVFASKAKLNSTGGAWRVYDDYLDRQLAAAERGEED